MCGTVCEDMHLKDLVSIERVGFCIPVLGFYLMPHALRCQKMHYNGLFINEEYMTSGLRGVKKVKIVYYEYNDRKSTMCGKALSGKFGGPTK